MSAVGPLTPAQSAELLQHFMNLDVARLTGANALLAAILTHPDCTDALIEILNAWSADSNTISEISNAEIVRIETGAPKKPTN